MTLNRIFQLSETDPGHIFRLYADRVDARSLAEKEGTVTRWVTVTRTGTFKDPRYGVFQISRDMLLAMKRNFDQNTYRQEIMLDLSHDIHQGAAGFIRELRIEGTSGSAKLRALVEFTEYGVDAVRKRGFIYLSAEFTENYISNEAPFNEYGPLLMGAALTPRPVIKGADAVKLAEHDDPDGRIIVLVSDYVIKQLSEDLDMTLKEMMDQLRKKLGEFNLAEAIISNLIRSYETVASKMAQEDIQRTLMEGYVGLGKQLAEQSGQVATDITLDLTGLETMLASRLDGGGTKTLTEADIERILAERDAKRLADDAKTQQALSENVALFERLIKENDGLKSLSEEQTGKLLSAKNLITADMDIAYVTRLAEREIERGNELIAQQQLASQGFQVPGAAGSVQITVDSSNSIKELQETVDRRLGLADLPDSRRYRNTGGQLQPENKALADRFLAIYDALHAPRLHAERKLLAAGDGVVGDTSVPASFERTVIRESIYNMVGLQFVDANTLPFAASHMIPYSFRDTTAAGINDVRRYQGQGIDRAGVIQAMETAYAIPQKVSFVVSDELRYLTAAAHLNWDAVVENQRNATRIIGEDTDRLIYNEILQASDEFDAVAVANEDLGAQTDAANQIFVTSLFPIVRPRSIYDLEGNLVGSMVNPITITLAGSEIQEYAGQTTPGTYYVMDYNQGEFYFIDENFTIQTPGGADTLVISYSYATNCFPFDTDLGGAEVDAHWDKFLFRYGLRKSLIEDSRYYSANFGLMSGNVMTQVEQAKQFGANSKRPGTDLALDGSLGRVKDVPNYKSTAPAVWMGDQRIIIGERGQTRLRMMKPWTMGELENQRNADSKFTGKKEAYGDQFILLHTPTQLKAAYTSMVLYSSSGRVARAAA